MALTPKQVRNGIPEPAANNSSIAQPGPEAVFPQAAAEAAGNAKDTASHLMTPGSSGVVDWDDGLAVSEQPGEA